MNQTSCDDFRSFIDPYLDGEFDEREHAMFDAHLSSCRECRDYFDQRYWLIRAVKPKLQHTCRMSSNARSRLEQRLKSAQRPRRIQRAAKNLARPVPALAIVGAAVLFFMPLTGFKANVVEDVVDQHCQTVPVEWPTPETREVDDWFADKLPFRVATPQFRDQRVMLLGGRISRIRPIGREIGLPAAHILYQVGSHKMSVLVFQAKDLVDLEQSKHTIRGNRLRMHDARGHRVALFHRGNLTYAVTSTLPENEMLGLLGTSL